MLISKDMRHEMTHVFFMRAALANVMKRGWVRSALSIYKDSFLKRLKQANISCFLGRANPDGR